MQKDLRNLSTMFCIFSVHYQPEEILRTLCVIARTMYGLEMHLMFCCNELWIYLHICSLFKSIFFFRVNNIIVIAIPIQFIMNHY